MGSQASAGLGEPFYGENFENWGCPKTQCASQIVSTHQPMCGTEVSVTFVNSVGDTNGVSGFNQLRSSKGSIRWLIEHMQRALHHAYIQ